MAAAIARLTTVPPGSGHLVAAVVVDDLAPESFLTGAIDFALAVPEPLRLGWQRSYTRTIFLAGRPRSVVSRHPDGLVTADASFAWYGPAPEAKLRPLSRLLRAFHGPEPVPAPAGPVEVTVPGVATGHLLQARVATDGVTARDYLVHVHHLVAEATIRGLVRPGDVVRFEHRPHLDDADSLWALDPAYAPFVQSRIARRHAESEAQRLYGLLISDRAKG